MRIHFFYRNHRAGYSIGRVFDSVISQFPDKQKIEVPCYNCSPISMLRNFLYVFMYRNKRVINHITGDIHYVMPALVGCKSVLTIHDTSSYDCSASKIKRLLVKLLWFTIPLKLATKVVCISEETRRSISRFTHRKDIKVIYNPVDEALKTSLKQMNAKCPKFLIIGTAWNKNVENTLRALDGIDGEVTIVGSLNESQNRVANNLSKINVTRLSGLSDTELIEEYKKCDVVLFCTIFEGFGMPIIEGQKTGRAIVTSNIEPHKEIAGDGALFVNPHSVESIRNAVLSIICNNELYNRLVEKGLENVKRFEVNKIAKEYANVYKEIYDLH